MKNSLRIIGGSHRGRKLHFPNAKGLRPTADRLRETLFNWLQAEIAGSRCLDLFAGSGALGFEALSRGAAFVQFVEQSKIVCRCLAQNIQALGFEQCAQLSCQNALRWLEQYPLEFDIIFIDPPFQSHLMPAVLSKLQASTCRWLYLEAADLDWIKNNEYGTIHRQARAGQAQCALIRLGD